MIKSAFLIVATCCSLQLFSQEKFPDGKIIPDWFYKNEKTGKIYNENLISPYEKSDNYSLIFNYDLFKSLIV